MINDKAVWAYKTPPAVKKLRDKYVEDLTTKEKGKIKELRNRMDDELESKHDDYFLLKWLVAKKWDLNLAENMLREHLKWLKEWRVEQIHEEFTTNEVMDKYIPVGKIGEDQNGRPFYILPLGRADPLGLLSALTLKEITKYAIYNLEYGERLMAMQSEKFNKVINSYMAIVDMEHFHYGVIVWKSVMELIITILKLIEDHYPGIIGRLFVVNTSRLFTVVYSMVKPFLRDDTKTRVFIFKKDLWKELLLNDLNPDQLPVHWGGELTDRVDGNPYCSSQIGMGGVVPKSHYMTQNRDLFKDNYIPVTIGGRSTLAVDVEVPEDGSTLRYSFWTEKHDIAFAIVREKDNLLPLKKYSCQLVPEKGNIDCHTSGTYKLIFDNRHSLYKCKKVFYQVKVSPAIVEKL